MKNKINIENLALVILSTVRVVSLLWLIVWACLCTYLITENYKLTQTIYN